MLATLHLAGNIFAASTSGDNCFNCGTLNDNGYNLSDDATCTNGGTGSATNATLNLGALADNGGPTLTHLPGAGSAAIGAIPNGTTISNNGPVGPATRPSPTNGATRARSIAAIPARQARSKWTAPHRWHRT